MANLTQIVQEPYRLYVLHCLIPDISERGLFILTPCVIGIILDIFYKVRILCHNYIRKKSWSIYIHAIIVP